MRLHRLKDGTLERCDTSPAAVVLPRAVGCRGFNLWLRTDFLDAIEGIIGAAFIVTIAYWIL